MYRVSFALVLALFGVQPLARAQDAAISATKTVDQPLSSNLYGRIETRHDAQILYDEEGKILSQPAFLEFRPVIGGKFYDKKLDTKVTYFIQKRPATEEVTQRRPEWETKLSAFGPVEATTQPFVKAYLPFKGSGTDADVGLRELGTVTIEKPYGALRFFYQLDAGLVVSSRDKDAKIENESGEPASEYGLVGKESDDGEVTEPGFKRDPTYKTVYLLGTGLVPASVPNLTTLFSVAMKPVHTPKYKLHENGEVYASYELRRPMETKWDLIYKLNKEVILGNELYYYNDGFYEQPKVAKDRAGKPRYENIMRVEYLLF